MSSEKANNLYWMLVRSDSHTVLDLKLLLQVYVTSISKKTDEHGASLDKISITDHASMLNVTPPAVSKHVDNLVMRGLVKRVRHSGGSRRTLVALNITPLGAKWVRRILGVKQ
jgi:DNA-binding MarR family transcriptional regulator